MSLIFIPATHAGELTRATNDENTIKGSLMIMGGAIRVDNAAVWERLVKEAGGKAAKIAVIPAASGNPERSANAAIETLKRYGADAFAIPLSIKFQNLAGKPQVEQVNRDSEWIKAIESANAVYFTGGDQSRITQALLNKDGSKSPLLEAIWSLYRRGGLVAGSSAGAAIMSETMFANVGSVLSTLQNGVRDGKEITAGLGFIGKGIFVDQHLIIRGRFARMLPVMMATQTPLGLGIDENTAMLITKRRKLEIIGYKGAIFLDLSQATNKAKKDLPNFNLQNVRISYLNHGDKLDLQSKQITPSADKSILETSEDEEAEQAPRISTDILANTVVIELMSRLIDSKNTSAKGIAFEIADAKTSKPELGFEFTFSKTPQSRGYFSNASGAEAYTICELRLDIQPIKIKAPIYEK